MSIELLNGDCFELIKNVPDKSIDFVLTDPPYEFKVARMGGGSSKLAQSTSHFKEQISQDNFSQEFDCERLMANIERVCKKVNCVIFGTEYMMLKLMNYAQEHNYIFNLTLWHKTNVPPFTGSCYLKDCEFAIMIKEKGVKMYGDYYSLSRVFESPINTKDKEIWGHPTMKPVELMEKYIINHTKEGDTVLDFYTGSGTTAIACKKTERNFIGFELDKTFYSNALKRIDQYKVQRSLF